MVDEIELGKYKNKIKYDHGYHNIDRLHACVRDKTTGQNRVESMVKGRPYNIIL